MISDVISIINVFCNLIMEFTINNVDIISIAVVVLCIGWIIHSLANKEP